MSAKRSSADSSGSAVAASVASGVAVVVLFPLLFLRRSYHQTRNPIVPST